MARRVRRRGRAGWTVWEVTACVGVVVAAVSSVACVLCVVCGVWGVGVSRWLASVVLMDCVERVKRWSDCEMRGATAPMNGLHTETNAGTALIYPDAVRDALLPT